MNRRRRRISNFFMALTVSILFTAGVMAISWLLVERMMGISFERTRQFLQKTGLSQLTLSEDGFYEIRTPEDFQNFWEGVATQDPSARGRLLSDIYLNDAAGMEKWVRACEKQRGRDPQSHHPLIPCAGSDLQQRYLL